jgi:predicted transcriptional regulator
LTLLNQKEKVTARDIADYFQLAINTASNRLSELYKRHLALRHEEIMPNGGKQFMYHSLLLVLRNTNQ